MFRSLFPSFEQPSDRPRYLNIESERRSYHGIGIVVLLAASCGVALALWEPSHQLTSPFVTASTPRIAPATAPVPQPETTATVDADDDHATPTVKLSTLCSQRSTARRDCANVRALKDARLNAPDPEPGPASAPRAVETVAKAPPAAELPAAVAAVAAPAAAQLTTVSTVAAPAAAQAETPAPAPQKPKAKRARPADEAPVERLVRVYDQILPDGRRVPVYRRVGSGGYETGTIVDGEYRPTRRANLDSPYGHNLNLQ